MLYVSHRIADVMEAIKEAGITDGCDRVLGNLMWTVFVET